MTLTVTILKRSLVPNDFRNFIYSLSKDWNATAIGMKTHQYLMYGASLEAIILDLQRCKACIQPLLYRQHCSGINWVHYMSCIATRSTQVLPTTLYIPWVNFLLNLTMDSYNEISNLLLHVQSGCFRLHDIIFQHFKI